MSIFVLKPLPPVIDLKIKSILKKSASAHRYLAELKGVSETSNYYINVKLYSILTNTGIMS